MHEVRLHVVQDALVVRNHEHATVGLLLVAVNALGDNAQCVNVQTRVGLIHHRELRLEQGKLHNLVALLLAAGEAFVHGALGEGRIHVQRVTGSVEFTNPLAQLRSLAAHSCHSGAHEVRRGHARYLYRVLHGQKETGTCALVNIHVQDVFTVQKHLALGDLVARVACQGVCKRGLTGAVRAHDGVGFAALDGQVHAFKNRSGFLAFLGGKDVGVQVLDFQSGHINVSFSCCSARARRRHVQSVHHARIPPESGSGPR